MSLLKKLPKPMLPDEARREIQARESYHVLKIISEFVEAGEELRAIQPAVSIYGTRARRKTIPTTNLRCDWHASSRMPVFPSFRAAGRGLWKRRTRARLRAQALRWG